MKVFNFLKKSAFMWMMVVGMIMVQAQSSENGLALEGAQIIVDSEEYHQVFIGIGGSVSFYNQYFSLSEDDREEVLKLLAEDLNLKFAKNYVGDVPENDPFEFESSATYWSDLKRYNPDINFQLTVNNLPDHLEGEGDGHDPSIEGIMDSIANYYFKALEYYHNEGLTVLQLDVINERGLSEKVTDLFDIGIDKLREIINDPMENPNEVPMPQVCGPSTWSAASPTKWIEDWKENRPNAWDNVDVVTTHGYQQGTFENYKAIFDVAEGKPFYNNEQTGKIQDDEGTGADAVDDLAKQFVQGEEPDHVGDVSIAMRMSDVINAGGNAFFPFRLTNSNGNNAALVGTRNGTYEPSKIYYGVKHISSVQPDSSYRVSNTSVQTEDYRIVTFRKPGEDTVYVHVTNVWPETQTIKIAVGDGTEAYGIKSVVAWTSNEELEFSEVLNESLDQTTNAIEFTVTPHSVNSLKLAVDPSGFELQKKAQTLAFQSIADTEVGTSVTLEATSDSELDIQFEVLSGSATVDANNTLNVAEAGEITVRAYQVGTAAYFSSEQILTFCGLPQKPTVTVEGNVLTSSSETNNQWYLEGEAIGNATDQSYEISQDGNYAVQVTINDCSNISDEVQATLVLLGVEGELKDQYSIFKNREGWIEILSEGSLIREVHIHTLNGQIIRKRERLNSNHVLINSSFAPGIYIIQVVDSNNKGTTVKMLNK